MTKQVVSVAEKPFSLRRNAQLLQHQHVWRNLKSVSAQYLLITGALNGIGRATAVGFARLGASVVVSGRHEYAGQRLRAELEALGAEAELVKADVRNEDDVRRRVSSAVARFGRLDVAVNNAGTEGELGPIAGQAVDNQGLSRVLYRPCGFDRRRRELTARGGERVACRMGSVGMCRFDYSNWIAS
jgi:hypothetical protein